MKKLWILAVFGIICACGSTGTANTTAAEPSNLADLDTAIQQASREINEALPAETKVALLNFSSTSDVFSDYVLEEISIALVGGRKLVVVDRREIDLIRKEMDFQLSGEVSDESAQEIGKKLGAQSIVSGSLVNMGESYRFRTKVINVNSAAIETSSSISVRSDQQIRYLLSQGSGSSVPRTATVPGGAQAVPAQAVTPGTAQPVVPAEPALRAYKIGETGPAGGLIFYDKGNNNNGWRYLEAAPEEAEFVAIWSVHHTFVENTRSEIGYGRRNTQLIIETLRQTTGEWDTAAQKIFDLECNGFRDWFLPSQDELDQMYGNLKRRNLGDFKNEFYWSSTQYRSSGNYSYDQNFNNGKMDYNSKTYRRYVRPIRQVPGPVGTARGAADSSSGTKTKFWGQGGVLYTILGVLLIGGILTFIILGPSPSSDMAPGHMAPAW